MDEQPASTNAAPLSAQAKLGGQDLYASLPLDAAERQIRVLHLWPACSGGEVRCWLSVISLTSFHNEPINVPGEYVRLLNGAMACVTTYNALSYPWGLSEPARTIKVNGVGVCDTEPIFCLAERPLFSARRVLEAFVVGCFVHQSSRHVRKRATRPPHGRDLSQGWGRHRVVGRQCTWYPYGEA
jgi:hypothetical protein